MRAANATDRIFERNFDGPPPLVKKQRPEGDNDYSNHDKLLAMILRGASTRVNRSKNSPRDFLWTRL